jgi:hypothetical protein
MPLPQPLHGAGKGRAVERRIAATWSGLREGLAANISAATPATCGAAI